MFATMLFRTMEEDQTVFCQGESAQASTPDVPQRSKPPKPSEGGPYSQTAKAVYVATNLDTWVPDDPGIWNRDAALNGTVYRRLDPMYYAWLRQRMNKVKDAHVAGKMGTEAYEMLRSRFNLVHAWAIGLFGEDDLKSSLRNFQSRASRYQPPSRQWLIDIGVLESGANKLNRESDLTKSPGYLFPAEGNWACTAPIIERAVTKVDAIKDQALALGWSMGRLYQNRGHMSFPYGDDYGLVCFLRSEDRIGNVTKEAIEIVKRPPWYNRMLFKRKA